jgi:D-alanyl-D-alanine carboxypeptidase
MPISVGGPRNVDDEGGTPHGNVRYVQVVGVRRMGRTIAHHYLRKRLEQEGLQLDGTVRGASAARIIELANEALYVQAAALASFSTVAELTDDADDHGTDGS